METANNMKLTPMPVMNFTEQTIKSKERVRDVAEVFTAKKQVEDMLDLVKNHSENIDSTFLEPACGNGNFLVAILERKLKTILEMIKNPRHSSQIWLEFNILKAVSSIYGIDIMQDNIEEARNRLKYIVKEFFSNNFNTRKIETRFWQSLDWILTKNIVLGDSLNSPEKIIFLEYKSPKLSYFKIKEFYFIKPTKNSTSLFEEETLELKIYPITHYLDIPNLCS